MGNRQSIDFFKGPMTVRLETGFIQQRKEDVIVNSTTEDLDLQRNASARALAASAGPQLQQECRKLAPLQIAEAQITQAYNLKCKRVLHCNFGGKYSGKESVEELERGIKRCLSTINQSGEYKSIAFSAIGTGGLKFPDEVVAGCFIKCLEEFISENIEINLSLVSVVIAPNNPFIFKSFAKIFRVQRSTDESASSLVTLDEESVEFHDVRNEFLRTFDSCVTVLQIQKVNNESELEKYNNWREAVSKRNQMSKKEVERLLWHGTTEETVSKIAKYSFNRSYAGVNGTKYGVGTYFARDSSKSAEYTSPNRSNERHMIFAKVITGNYTFGKKGLTDAPITSTGDKYDSVVDNVVDPSIYAVFHDNAAYPQYVIKYTNSPQQRKQVRPVGRICPQYTPSRYSGLCLEVEAAFKESIGKNVIVLQIHKIQNTEWENYRIYRDQVSEKLKLSEFEVERKLWHATTEETASEIERFHFNRSCSGKNASLYGKGCHFARDASYYSNDVYSVPNSDGEKFIILARVVVGQYTLGHSSFIDAPKTNSGGKFDSVVDNMENPSVFVTFAESAAYPDYIIKYKLELNPEILNTI